MMKPTACCAAPRRRPFFVVLGAALTLCLGCGASKGTVTGEVFVNGKLVDKGVISFVDTEDRAASVTTTIENGRYSLETTAGNKLVQISVPIVVDKKREYEAPDAPWIEITRESLPERYHVKSELTFEVRSGANQKSWELQTK